MTSESTIESGPPSGIEARRPNARNAGCPGSVFGPRRGRLASFGATTPARSRNTTIIGVDPGLSRVYNPLLGSFREIVPLGRRVGWLRSAPPLASFGSGDWLRSAPRLASFGAAIGFVRRRHWLRSEGTSGHPCGGLIGDSDYRRGRDLSSRCFPARCSCHWGSGSFMTMMIIFPIVYHR
jgi:hypothetical protein